jgi:hypothetical protein
VRRARTGIEGGGTAAAFAAGALLLALAGCGGDQPQDRRFGTFTDCATLGRVTAVSDVRGDQRGRTNGAPAQPQGDLVALRLARAGGRLCVEYRAAAPIRAPTAYALALRPPDGDAPVLQMETLVLAGEDPEVVLRTAGAVAGRHLPATVGIDGDRLSVVVTRAALAAAGAGARFDAFRWQARTFAVPSRGVRVTDCMPACD